MPRVHKDACNGQRITYVYIKGADMDVDVVPVAPVQGARGPMGR